MALDTVTGGQRFVTHQRPQNDITASLANNSPDICKDLAETVSITQRHTTLSVSSLFIERDIQRFCSKKETCGTHTYLQSSSASSPSSPRKKKQSF